MKIIRLLLTILTLTVISSCTQKEKPHMPQQKKGEIWFFVHTDKGEIKQGPNGEYTLQVSGDNFYYLYDRPIRRSGGLAVRDFISMWNPGATFDQDNPNAAFFAQRPNSTARDFDRFTCIVTKAQYDPATHTVTFTIQPLDARQSIGPGQYVDVIFFVDGENNLDGGLFH